MAGFARIASSIWRNFSTDGVQASGVHTPVKSEIREWGTEVERVLGGLGTAGGYIFATKASLDASLAYPSNTQAWVYADATAANNGVYVKSGASGSGSWFRATDLPFAVVPLTVSGGTANAIVATSPLPVPQGDRGAILLLTPSADNTGAATLAVNGEPALALTGPAGEALAAGSLKASAALPLIKVSGAYRTLFDARIEVFKTAAEASATAAAASQSAAATSAAAALTSSGQAATSASAASGSASAASAAAEAAGPFTLYGTKAAADAALAGLAADAYVQVLVDESQGGARTVYQKSGGAYVYKRTLDRTIPRAATRTVLKAQPTSTDVIYLSEAGREGMYAWDATVAVARHQADLEEYDLVPPASGSAGAWRRVEKFGSTAIRARMQAITTRRVGGRCVLVKARATGATEFHVYTQDGPGSPEFARWVMTNHPNSPSAQGSLRNSSTTRATMYRTAALSPPPAVPTLGSYADDIASGAKIFPASSGTETGTFTASTIGGHAIRWSATVGEKVVYTVRGVELLLLRGYATTNGGTAHVTITQGGSGIASDKWVVPLNGSDRVVSFVATGSLVGHVAHVLAKGLDRTLDYVVTVEVHSSNPSGGRMYQAGLAGYDSGWQMAAGSYGVMLATSGIAARYQRVVGDRVVYHLRAATRIDWRARKTSERGIAAFELYDAAGNAVAVTTATYDCYSASTASATVTIASGLPKADYFLHVIVSGTKHASSTGIGIDHFGATVVDETQAGDLATESFEIFGGQPLGTSAAGTSEFIGWDASNLGVMAICKSSESVGASADVGGVHGHETLVSVVVKVDGVTVDYAGAALLQRWIGETIEAIVTTTVLFPSDSSPAATAVYTYRLTPAGLEASMTVTATADIKCFHLYAVMLTFPTSTIPAGATAGVGGGFGNVSLEPRGAFAYAASGFETTLPVTPDALAVWNGDWAVAAWPTGWEALRAVFSALGGDDGNREAHVAKQTVSGSEIGRHKAYLKPFGKTSGITIPSGTVWTSAGFWGVARARDMFRLG